MRLSGLIAPLVAYAFTLVGTEFAEETAEGKHHKHHHHHKHKHGVAAADASGAEAVAQTNSTLAHKVAGSATVGAGASVAQVLGKMKALEKEMAAKDDAANATKAISAAAPIKELKVSFKLKDAARVETQAQPARVDMETQAQPSNDDASVSVDLSGAGSSGATQGAVASSVEPCSQDIDIDTEMPYGELEPFGREDTAQELTESSITESDEMVDQLERAEVAEEKRAVFRALTRLRGAAITSFDGVARSQTGNIDEYNKVHKWRMTHPLRHLADEESDISKWAFPDNADF